jgi:hypothetical protein
VKAIILYVLLLLVPILGAWLAPRETDAERIDRLRRVEIAVYAMSSRIKAMASMYFEAGIESGVRVAMFEREHPKPEPSEINQFIREEAGRVLERLKGIRREETIDMEF